MKRGTASSPVPTRDLAMQLDQERTRHDEEEDTKEKVETMNLT